MLDDHELVKRLQKLSGPELLDAIAVATGGKTIEQKQEEAAEAVREYLHKGDSIANYGPEHSLNAAALELHRRSTEQDEES